MSATRSPLIRSLVDAPTSTSRLSSLVSSRLFHETNDSYIPLYDQFPDGESYMDVFARLESLLLEMVAEPQPVVVVAHLAVLRVIYG